MSEHFLKLYAEAREAQAVKNEARHIWTKIREARGSPHDAAVRWPFELLQNAIDSGPREDRNSVDITLTDKSDSFVFEHDGAFFKTHELAALLSGGSSKEFEDPKTTGRFGTGFLVTHVLAPRVQLVGLVDTGDQIERVDLLLDRGGGEDSILQNIQHCNEAIERAMRVLTVEGAPSARFTYAHDDVAYLREGLETFRQTLPYLFVTRPLLGDVRLEFDKGTVETWQPGLSFPGCSAMRSCKSETFAFARPVLSTALSASHTQKPLAEQLQS